jgi:hypothetical protein
VVQPSWSRRDAGLEWLSSGRTSLLLIASSKSHACAEMRSTRAIAYLRHRRSFSRHLLVAGGCGCGPSEYWGLQQFISAPYVLRIEQHNSALLQTLGSACIPCNNLVGPGTAHDAQTIPLAGTML